MIPFPAMIINQMTIKNTLASLKLDNPYDLNLISECIVLEAFGIFKDKPQILNPTVGESIHLFGHSLH